MEHPSQEYPRYETGVKRKILINSCQYQRRRRRLFSRGEAIPSVNQYTLQQYGNSSNTRGHRGTNLNPKIQQSPSLSRSDPGINLTSRHSQQVVRRRGGWAEWWVSAGEKFHAIFPAVFRRKSHFCLPLIPRGYKSLQ